MNIHGVDIITKFRWKSGFLGGPYAPRGYRMQLSANICHCFHIFDNKDLSLPVPRKIE